MGPILKKNQHFFKCNSKTFSVKSIFCSYGAVYKGVTSSSIEHHISVDEQQTYSHPQIFSDYKNVLARFIFPRKIRNGLTIKKHHIYLNRVCWICGPPLLFSPQFNKSVEEV